MPESLDRGSDLTNEDRRRALLQPNGWIAGGCRRAASWLPPTLRQGVPTTRVAICPHRCGPEWSNRPRAANQKTPHDPADATACTVADRSVGCDVARSQRDTGMGAWRSFGLNLRPWGNKVGGVRHRRRRLERRPFYNFCTPFHTMSDRHRWTPVSRRLVLDKDLFHDDNRRAFARCHISSSQ